MRFAPYACVHSYPADYARLYDIDYDKGRGARRTGERDTERRGEIGIGIRPILLPARLEMTAGVEL